MLLRLTVPHDDGIVVGEVWECLVVADARVEQALDAREELARVKNWMGAAGHGAPGGTL